MLSKTARIVAALGILTLAVACDDGPTGPATIRESVARPIPIPQPGGPALELTSANVNICQVSTPLRQGGNAVDWRIDSRERLHFDSAPTDTTIVRLGLWRFDAEGRQSERVECILTSSTANRLRNIYRKAPEDPTGFAPSTAIIGVGTVCTWIDNTNDLMCGGERCFSMMALRGAREGPIATRWDGTLANSVVAVWECQGGGGISLSSDGTVTYHLPPGGDEGGDGGGGSSCGGGGGEPGDTIPQWDELQTLSCDSVSVGDWYGLTEQQWNSLSAEEKRLVASDPFKWAMRYRRMKDLRDYAFTQAMQIVGSTTLQGTDDTRQNAIQHAIWAAALKREWGHRDALLWTNAHENNDQPYTLSNYMDLYNNSIGLNVSGLSGPNGSAAQDVINGGLHSLCWLQGTGASASCTP